MKIHVIETGRVWIKEKQQRGQGRGASRMLHTLLDKNWTPSLPIYAWVIEHPEGLVVVDTGETAKSSETGYFPRWHPYFKTAVRTEVDRSEEIGVRLKNLGFSINDVRWLVLTHLHTDHAGGLHHFPEIDILVSRKEYQMATGIRGQMRGYLPHRWPGWFEPTLIDFSGPAYGPFPSSQVLTAASDVILVPTPGHTHGHLSVIVRDGSLSYFLAGDTSYTEKLLIEQVIDGVSPDDNAARKTLSIINQYVHGTPTVYLPSHDPESIYRLVNKVIVKYLTDTSFK